MRPQYFWALISFAIIIVAIGSILWLDYRQPEGINTTLLTQIISLLSPLLLVTLNLLKSAGNSEELREVKKEQKEQKYEIKQVVRQEVRTAVEESTNAPPPKT